MRRLCVMGVATLVCVVLGAAPAMAQPSPSADPGPIEQAGPTQEEAVSLVIASEPLFTDLPDYELLRRKAASEFNTISLLGSDYYRVLGTMAAQFSDYGMVVLRYPGSWLIEVALVRDCMERLGDSGPWPEPCGWRHSWFYRVQPDGTVTLLFDEGDPPPMPDPLEQPIE